MPQRQRIIAFLVGSPCDLINLVAISSVFSYPTISGKQAYVSKVLSTEPGDEIRSSDGLTVSNCIPYADYKGQIDILVVIGGESAFTEPSSEVVEWIKKRAAQVRRIVSVCTGAFTLAPTGLLDGKRMTTHWHHAHRLSQKYPKLLLEKDQIFVKHGKLYSTAGVTAGIDVALSIVEEDFGHKTASSIAHTLVLYLRRPGNELQYSTLLAQQADLNGTPMSELPAWTKARLNTKLNVKALAQAISMTPRTFARQFEQHFQTTPARWIQSLRVEAACAYLGGQELPVKIIASLTGFRDEKSLRRAFLQQLSMTPKEYRERFGLLRTTQTK